MPNNIKNLLQVFATLSVSKLMVIAAGFVMAVNLSKFEFGTYSLLLAVASGIIPLIALNSAVGLMRETTLKNSNSELNSFFSEYFYYLYKYSLWVVATGTFFVFLFTFDQSHAGINVFFCGLLALFLSIAKAMQIHLRFTSNYKIFSTLELGRSLILLLACFALLKLDNILYVLVCSYSVIIFLIFRYWKKNSQKPIDHDVLKRIIHISLPSIVTAYSAYLINMSDRLLVEFYIGREALADYSFAYNIGMGVLLVFDSVFIIIQPKLLRLCHNNKRKAFRVINLFVLAASVFSGIIFLLFNAFGFMIVRYMPSDYLAAINIVPIIAIAFIIRFMYQLFNTYQLSLGETGFIAYITFFSGLVNVSLNILFLETYGIIFAAYSTVIAFSIIAFLSFLKMFFNHRDMLYERN